MTLINNCAAGERPWTAPQRMNPQIIVATYRSAEGAAPPKGKKISAASQF
jgi:hypothetical protein